MQQQHIAQHITISSSCRPRCTCCWRQPLLLLPTAAALLCSRQLCALRSLLLELRYDSLPVHVVSSEAAMFVDESG
jgi:hypothetical protein